MSKSSVPCNSSACFVIKTYDIDYRYRLSIEMQNMFGGVRMSGKPSGTAEVIHWFSQCNFSAGATLREALPEGA